MLLSAGEGEEENSLERDIMQVQCVIDIFTFCIQMYIIIYAAAPRSQMRLGLAH